MSKKPACYFVSLKYAPGLWKEFHLLGRNILQSGFPVKYLISKGYEWMTGGADSDVAFVSSSRDLKEMLADVVYYPGRISRACVRAFRSAPPGFLCLYNPHPLNVVVARLARHYAPDGVRAIYLHEPAKPGKVAYGLKGRLFFEIVEFCQKLAVASSTDVILPSPLARELFYQYFRCYHGRVHYAPILVPDCPGETTAKRRYFSMVGRFSFSKRLDAFIEMVNYAAENGEDLEFQIVTASPIDHYINRLTPAATSRIRIFNKKKISDEEISKGIAESFAVLCLHPMVSQSGVVPVAFMNATPVIARSIPGFTQFIEHGTNGWLLPEKFSSADLVEAMKNVKVRFEMLSANARQSYVNLFSPQNWGKYYGWLIDILNVPN